MLRNTAQTKHEPLEFMKKKNEYFLLSNNSEMPSNWTKRDVKQK